MLRIGVLSIILFLSSALASGAGKEVPVQDPDVVMVPKAQMIELQRGAAALIAEKERLEAEVEKAKEFLSTGKGCV